ncbi:MAG TPA: right-handed parallel beta-helix repeat-containing protein [Tepidisphaeraceae bacterium]|nr:right-handed parallel beta-helix repeat-containing protein [Tepidisphaeraceae bacterium]
MQRPLPARSACEVEPLEERKLLSLSMSSDGWVQINPSEDSRVIYVSSSIGNDKNDGHSPHKAVRTIRKAKSLMRDGMPDQMLLRRGDTFDESFGHWTRSGRSSDEPMVLGTYGSGDRPLLNTGVSEGFVTYDGDPINNIAIMGIHFEANKYTGSNGGYQTSGIHLLRQGDGYLFQDIEVNGYKDNIVLQGDGSGVSSVILRRSIITGAYNTGKVGNGHAQGFYAAGNSSHLMIEQNVFDHNGWKEDVAQATAFNHNVYVNTGATSVTVRNNIIARASLNGVLLRCGGLIIDNLFVRNPVAAVVDKTSSTISGNVVLEGTDLPTQSLGVGFNIERVPSAIVSDNLIAHDIATGQYGKVGISINTGAQNTTVDGNTIYDWRNNIVNRGTSGITISDNVLHQPDASKPLIQQQTPFNKKEFFYSGNIYSSKRAYPFLVSGKSNTFKKWIKAVRETGAAWEALHYPDPKRTLGKYNATLGGRKTVEAFLAAADRQSQSNWDLSYTAEAASAYIRGGFGMESTPTTLKLKLSPKATYLTTIDVENDEPSSVTTKAPHEVSKAKKKKNKKKESAPEAQTVKADSSKDDSSKSKSPVLTQMRLIQMIMGLS